jgi:AbrB family looped-hinge helix DNA binding protein
MKTTVDGAGRMVIPKPVREAAGLRPGDPLEIRYCEGRIEIEPVVEEIRLVREGPFLVADSPGAPVLMNEEVGRVMDEIRQERGQTGDEH